jgi:hypothetical protein
MIVAHPGSSLWNDARFRNNDWDSSDAKFATIGAAYTPGLTWSGLCLYSGVNREGDADLDNKSGRLLLGSVDRNKVDLLFDLNDIYDDNAIYWFFPEFGLPLDVAALLELANPGITAVSLITYIGVMNDLFGSYNSNSFARGILQAAGFTNVPSLLGFNTPGWDTPLSTSFFSSASNSYNYMDELFAEIDFSDILQIYEWFSTNEYAAEYYEQFSESVYAPYFYEWLSESVNAVNYAGGE